MKPGQDDVCIFTTKDVRHQLRVIAAITDSTIKETVGRLATAELNRVLKLKPGRPA